MKLFAMAVFCAALFFSPTAKADLVDFNGTASSFDCFGTACGPESFALSFVWDSTSGVVPNTMLFVATGPLGPFTFTGNTLALEEEGVFDWVDASGDYFQIFLEDYVECFAQCPADRLLSFVTQSGGTVQTPASPAFYLQAVDWPGYPDQPPIYAYLPMPGDGSLTITDLSDIINTPEPSALVLSVFGIAALLCFRLGARLKKSRAGAAAI